jgi:hypothetical protein
MGRGHERSNGLRSGNELAMSISEIASIITAAAALGSCILGWLNRGKIQEVHLSINSRMDQLLREAREAAHAAGALQQRTEDHKTPREK